MTKFSIKGKTAFCIEAGGAIRGTGGETWNPDGDSLNVDYTIKEVTSDNSVQSKAAYLGYYSKTNPTIKDYAFTQMMKHGKNRYRKKLILGVQDRVLTERLPAQRLAIVLH